MVCATAQSDGLLCQDLVALGTLYLISQAHSMKSFLQVLLTVPVYINFCKKSQNFGLEEWEVRLQRIHVMQKKV